MRAAAPPRALPHRLPRQQATSRRAPRRATASPASASLLSAVRRAWQRRRTRTLPCGLTLEYVSAPDVAFLYDEVFVQRCYASHGLPPLRPGDFVLDVGANIGVFALFAASQIGPGGTLLCAEPVPATAAVLRRNLARNAARCAAVDVRVRELGVSDATSDAAEITFYPRAAGWSSLYADDAEVERNVAAFAVAALGPALGALAAPLRPLAPLLSRLRGDARPDRAPHPLRAALAACGAALYAAALRAVLRFMRGGARRLRCRLLSLSALLAQESLSADVALLKIDVERAELDVLRGVAAADWRRIRAVAAEVHDSDGRLAQVTALLRQQPAAFDRVVAVQPDSLRGSNLWNVYATRNAAPDTAAAAAAAAAVGG